MGAVWLGMTVGCATCHDHKFDPILQKDFYALGAFFRNTTQKVMDGNVSDHAAHCAGAARGGPQRVGAEECAAASLCRAEIGEGAAKPPPGLSRSGLANALPESEAQPRGRRRGWIRGRPRGAAGVRQGGGARSSPRVRRPMRRSRFRSASVPVSRRRTRITRSPGSRIRATAIADGCPTSRGRQVGLPADRRNGAAIEVRAARRDAVPAGHVESPGRDLRRLAQSGRPDLYLNGRAVAVQGLGTRNARLNGGIEIEDPIMLGRSFTGGAIADFRLFHRVVTEADARLLSEWRATAAALARPTAELSTGARQSLFEWFVARSYEPYRALAS